MSGGTNMAKTKEELWQELYDICDKTNTRKSGMEYLVKYYISLGWSEEKQLNMLLSYFITALFNKSNFWIRMVKKSNAR